MHYVDAVTLAERLVDDALHLASMTDDRTMQDLLFEAAHEYERKVQQAAQLADAALSEIDLGDYINARPKRASQKRKRGRA